MAVRAFKVGGMLAKPVICLAQPNMGRAQQVNKKDTKNWRQSFDELFGDLSQSKSGLYYWDWDWDVDKFENIDLVLVLSQRGISVNGVY